MSREAALEDLYQGLSTLVRRARDLGDDLHPGLSLVAYTLLAQIDVTPEARAADLAAHFGVDKSTVSQQLEQLISAGLLRREGAAGSAVMPAGADRRGATAPGHRRPGRPVPAGRVAEWLTDWDDRNIAAFGALVSRFNQSTSRTYLAG